MQNLGVEMRVVQSLAATTGTVRSILVGIGGRENGERVYTEGEEGRNRQKKGKKGETRVEIGDGERKWERGSKSKELSLSRITLQHANSVNVCTTQWGVGGYGVRGTLECHSRGNKLTKKSFRPTTQRIGKVYNKMRGLVSFNLVIV